MFDGILRKWMFPSLSGQIMMIKQVIGIFIFLKGFKHFNVSTAYEKGFFVLGIVLLFTSLLFGHGNFIVAIYGCLPYWFGLSVCFIIYKTIRKEDVLWMSKILIYFFSLNTMLIIIQFMLPTTHWLNTTGGEVADNVADAAIGDLAGAFRPSGIFMHNVMLSSTILFLIPIIFYFLFVKKDFIKRNILLIAYFCCWISSVFAVSRTCVFYCVGATVFSLFIFGFKHIGKLMNFIIFFIVATVFALSTSLGQHALDNMNNRFDNAAASSSSKKTSTFEGTINDIYNRNIGYLIDAIVNPKTLDGKSVPFFGYGQGLSTQVGGRLYNNGEMAANSGFALAEWDGLRIICESGTLLGLIVLWFRLAYVFRFLPKLPYFRRRKMFLSLAIYPSFFFSFYVMFTWGNVTNANFAYLVGGLFLATYKYEKMGEVI